MVISECSGTEASKLIENLDLDICKASPDEINALAEDELSAFPWRSPFNENAQSADIVEHLRAHIGTFLDTQGYKLVDTHSDRSRLNFESSTIGKISGGIDAMIVPKRAESSGSGR